MLAGESSQSRAPLSPGAAGSCLTRRLFLALLGVVYLIAFASLWSQIDGLVGSAGIAPAGRFVDALRDSVERGENDWTVYFQVPSICHLTGASDTTLATICATGCVLAMLLVLGVAPLPCLVALWALYLSLASVCDVFLNFQWDTLLLEAGFLAIFLAPLRLLPDLSRERPPSTVALWLLRFLLFKFMVASGVVKLTYGDPSWWDGTALTFHYQTQPLPAWTSWYLHQLPDWFHQTSSWIVLVIEILVPCLIFFPRTLRVVPFVAFAALMFVVAASGNYGFFNLLTMALCVLLLDDSRFPRWLRSRVPTRRQTTRQFIRQSVLLGPVVVVTGFMFIVSTVVDTANRKIPVNKVLLEGAMRPYRAIRAFRSINSYGLFRVMTKTRPEITIQGSDDGDTWLDYEFPWKPGDPARRPAFVQPHMPRLDWQMWFAALRLEAGGGPPRWLVGFLRALGRNSGPLTELLENNPFPDAPPKFLRVLLHDYQFTDMSPAAGGMWWKRRLVREIFRVPTARLRRE